MQRRSAVVSGWVKFPVDDPAWKNSHEGGMFVKLVVCDNREFDDQFGVCSGVSVFNVLSESFIADDRRPRPAPLENYDTPEAVQAEQKAMADWDAYHFPSLEGPQESGVGRFLSRPYLASIVLGSTGWSGWSDTEGRSWMCRFDDLTDEGKALYRQIEALYPGCELHLLTFLDT